MIRVLPGTEHTYPEVRFDHNTTIDSRKEHIVGLATSVTAFLKSSFKMEGIK